MCQTCSKALPLLSAISIANREEFARSFPAGRVNSFHVMRLCVAPGGKTAYNGRNCRERGPAMYFADLHIHSRYSRATSKEGDLPHLDLGARKKGIALVGTGDFTHPAWRQEMEEQLLPAEEGLYRLKEEFRLPCGVAGQPAEPRFVVSGEISSIYKGGGGGALPPAGADRQYPLRRPSHPGPFQPRPAGDHPGGLPPGGVPPRPHLDAPLLPVRGLFRVRHPRGVLWGLDAPHPRGGDGAFLRPAHELAGVPAGRAAAGVPFRRPLPPEAGPGGGHAGHRALLPRPKARPGHRRRPCGHGRANTIWMATAAAACGCLLGRALPWGTGALCAASG